MANPTVWIIRIFKTADGWRALKPLWSKRSGKPLLTQRCLYKETEIDTPGGRWEIEWVEEGKRKRLKCGDQPTQVLKAKARQELRLQAQAAGIAVVDQKAENGKRLLATVKAEYLAECKANKAPKTHQTMKQVLDTFTMVVGRRHLEDVSRADCLTKFVNHLRGHGLADRTVYHRVACLVTFLKWAKHPIIGLKDASPRSSTWHKRGIYLVKPMECRLICHESFTGTRVHSCISDDRAECAATGNLLRAKRNRTHSGGICRHAVIK